MGFPESRDPIDLEHLVSSMRQRKSLGLFPEQRLVWRGSLFYAATFLVAIRPNVLGTMKYVLGTIFSMSVLDGAH